MITADSQNLFTPHQLRALRYRLIAGDVELSPLRILASRTLAWNDWQVTLHILGASHAVCLQRRDTRLTELLTCLPPLTNQNALLTLEADTRREDCFDASGLSCRLRLEPFSLEMGDALRHTPSEAGLAHIYPDSSEAVTTLREDKSPGGGEVAREGGQVAVSATAIDYNQWPTQRFQPAPSPGTDLPQTPDSRHLTPITRLGWRFIGDSLLIETVHTYPEEGRGLRSLTRFTPTGGL